MSENALKTLFLPFEDGLIPWPESGAAGIFYHARPCPPLSRLSGLCAVQDFYPYADKLLPTSSEGRIYDYALGLLPKQAVEARGIIAAAWHNVKPGGVFAFAADNDAGGSRLTRWMKEADITATVLSKNHARVAFGQKDSGDSAVMAAWHQEAAPRDVLIDGDFFRTQPGLFAWDHADAGSQLLAAHLPSAISGVGADFGCGYGWLARQAIKTNQKIEKIYLLDADRRAVAAAVHNVSGCIAEGIWADLTQPVPKLPPLDFIIMNPPFHEGKKESVEVGQAFIKTAAYHLKPGGALWMVANRHLPYEAILTTQFVHVITAEQKDGFKVLHATR